MRGEGFTARGEARRKRPTARADSVVERAVCVKARRRDGVNVALALPARGHHPRSRRPRDELHGPTLGRELESIQNRWARPGPLISQFKITLIARARG